MGKWIGQHIFDLVAKFRSDVFFKKVDNGDSDTDKFLIIGSSGKLKYRTGAQVLSDIGAGSGDITAVTITTDSGGGSAASDTAGSADFSILGSNGAGVTNSGTTITVQAVPSEIDHDSLQNFVAAEHYRWDTDISSTATINAANIPTLNQNTTGSAGTLTASTSNALGIGSIELGHASDTTIARSAAGIITVEGKQVRTADRQLHISHHSFTADIDTTKTYVGLVDADSESTTTTGIDMPLIFPTASKLLQVTLRSNKNLSGLTYTFRLETQATGVGFNTGPTIVGTQSGSGPAQTGHATYDFTTSLDSGDNLIDAFDAVYLSIESNGATANTKYYITCVWETDLSSY